LSSRIGASPKTRTPPFLKDSRSPFLLVVNGKNDPGAKPKIASGLIEAWSGKSQREGNEFGAAPATLPIAKPNESG